MLLTIVVPCYNEEAVLPETARRLVALLRDLRERGRIDPSSHVILIDDGSQDRTWYLTEMLCQQYPELRGIKLSRNRGHQRALLAGLHRARGDATISVDADLQDDLHAIDKMLDAYTDGAEVVYGVRKRRNSDTLFKRLSAEIYYKLLARMGVEVIFNHADYRLLGRRALNALRQYGESNLFLRGIVPQLGFKTSVVEYDRCERWAGESKYPLRKMLALAWDGITSFSAVPLRLITGLGVIVSLGSFGVALWALIIRLFSDSAVPGWASTVVPLYFLGGVQLLSLGIIGEYLAKIYVETKHRPPFFVDAEAGSWKDEPVTEQPASATRPWRAPAPIDHMPD